MNNYYVYAYCDPRKPGDYNYGEYHFEHEPIYVGKGKNSRWEKHLQDVKKHKHYNKIMEQRIVEIWNDNLKPIIYKYYDNINELMSFEYERDMIKIIGRLDLCTGPLCNLRDGGAGGTNPSKETINKMSLAKKGKTGTLSPSYGIKRSPEFCKKISDSQLGEKNHNYGKHFTKEHRNKISVSNKDRVFTDIHKEKISKANTGKIRSEEYKKYLSELNKGENHPQYGIPKSPESIAKQKETIRIKNEKKYSALLSDIIKVLIAA